jgi:hypothetical protein
MSRVRRRVVMGLAVGAVAAMAGVGVVQMASASDVPEDRGLSAGQPPASMTDAVSNRSADEKARDDAHNASLAPTGQVEAQILSNRIPVSGPDGFVGYIDRAALDAPIPRTAQDMSPIRDDAGTVVGYWGATIGAVDKEVVESGQFDLATERAKKGLGAPYSGPGPAPSR